MGKNIILIDLPNFYSNLLYLEIADKRDLRDYFLYWLDFDILVRSFARTSMGIWIFYSGQKFGPSDQRISGNILNDYIARINRLKGVTAYDVNIPGEQREPATFRCKSCQEENEVEWKSEKGIDTSLIVHLFDSIESWDTAYLLSGDADFVPAVSALRRKGKIVVGVGFRRVSSALVRECYDYIDIGKTFIHSDFGAFTLFKPDGLVERWLTKDVKRASKEFGYEQLDKRGIDSANKAVLSVRIVYSPESFLVKAIELRAAGIYADFSNRKKEAENFLKQVPIGNCQISPFQHIMNQQVASFPVQEGIEVSISPNVYLSSIDKIKQNLFMYTGEKEMPTIKEETYDSREGGQSLRFETTCIYDQDTHSYKFEDEHK